MQLTITKKEVRLLKYMIEFNEGGPFERRNKDELFEIWLKLRDALKLKK